MKRIALFVLALVVIVLALFLVLQAKPTSQSGSSMIQAATTPSPEPTSSQKEVMSVYTGELPCADCEGIDTVLMLYKDDKYTMSSTYKGRDVKPYIENGTWNTLRGDATNPNATVYQLTPEKQGTKQNYLVDGNKLKQLDQNMKLIQAPFDTPLIKQTAK